MDESQAGGATDMLLHRLSSILERSNEDGSQTERSANEVRERVAEMRTRLLQASPSHNAEQEAEDAAPTTSAQRGDGVSSAFEGSMREQSSLHQVASLGDRDASSISPSAPAPQQRSPQQRSEPVVRTEAHADGPPEEAEEGQVRSTSTRVEDPETRHTPSASPPRGRGGAPSRDEMGGAADADEAHRRDAKGSPSDRGSGATSEDGEPPSEEAQSARPFNHSDHGDGDDVFSTRRDAGTRTQLHQERPNSALVRRDSLLEEDEDGMHTAGSRSASGARGRLLSAAKKSPRHGHGADGSAPSTRKAHAVPFLQIPEKVDRMDSTLIEPDDATPPSHAAHDDGEQGSDHNQASPRLGRNLLWAVEALVRRLEANEDVVETTRTLKELIEVLRTAPQHADDSDVDAALTLANQSLSEVPGRQFSYSPNASVQAHNGSGMPRHFTTPGLGPDEYRDLPPTHVRRPPTVPYEMSEEADDSEEDEPWGRYQHAHERSARLAGPGPAHDGSPQTPRRRWSDSRRMAEPQALHPPDLSPPTPPQVSARQAQVAVQTNDDSLLLNGTGESKRPADGGRHRARDSGMREVARDAGEQLLLAPSFVDLGCAHAGCILKTRVRLRSNCVAWLSCRASVVGEDGGFVCEEAIAVPPHGEAFLRVALVSELPGVRRGFLHLHCTPTGPGGEPLSEDRRYAVMPGKVFNRTTCALRALLEAPAVVVAPPDAVRFGTVAVDSNMVQPILLHNPTSAPMLVCVRLNTPDGGQSPFSVWEQDPTPTLRAIARNRGDRETGQGEADLTPQSWLRSHASPAGARVVLPPMSHHEAEAVTVWVAFAPSASRDVPSDLLQSEDYNFHQEAEVILVGDVVAADGKVQPLRDVSSGEPSRSEDDDFLASLLEAVPERDDVVLAAIEFEGTCSTPRLQVPRVMQAMVLQANPGATAIRKIPVRNASRVPATVAVAIHSDSHAAGTSGFDVSPHQFDLGPMEVGEVAVHFTPPWPEADVAGKLSMTLLPNGTAYRLALRGQATSSSRPTQTQEMDGEATSDDQSQGQRQEAWGRLGNQLANGMGGRGTAREQHRAADLATGPHASPPASTGDMGILADQTVVTFGSTKVKQQTTARLRLRPAETSPDLDLRLELQGDEAAVGFFSLQGSSAVSLHWPQGRAAGGASAQIGVADLWHGQELAVDLQYAPQSVAVHRATLMIKARARGAKRYTYRFRVPLLGVAGQSRMLLEGAQVVGGSGRDVPLAVAPTGGANPTQLLTLRGTDCEPHKTLEVKLQLRNAGDRAGFLLARCVDMRGKPVHAAQVHVRPSTLVVGPQRRCSIQLALSSQALALLAPERHGAQDAIFTIQLYVGDEVL